MNKNKLKKYYKSLFMLALFASIIFFNSAFFFALPKNTFINGVNVSGLTKKDAVNKVRQIIKDKLFNKRLQICAGENIYSFSYPEIAWQDKLTKGVDSIKKSGNYSFEVTYHLNGVDSIISYICADVNKKVCEPYAIFNKQGAPFTYVGGKNGAIINAKKLKSDILFSLKNSKDDDQNFNKVTAQIQSVPHKTTLYSVKKKTALLSCFTTEYDEGNAPRSSNIRCACQKINGVIIDAQKTFSFNDIVGARTQQNGFLPAKIIEGGRFVDGLGGGVCQVSTTVYNAAILAGAKILEYHPHSLKVGYVAPSRDAMVSGNYFDLKFKNVSAEKLYVRTYAKMGKLTCEIYGLSDGAKYELSSVQLNEILPPPPEEVESDVEGVVVNEKLGVESEGYLTVTKNGVKKRYKIRTDKYAAVRGVLGKKPKQGASNP